MAKLTRFTQQVFGSTAAAGRMSEFGSLANGSPATYSGSTITPAIVQTLSNYLQGWDGAVIGGNSPALQDMNALQYLFSYQLGYLLQQGIAEYDPTTTYYTNSFVSFNGVVYVSLRDNNVGTPVNTGSSSWGQPIQNGTITINSMLFVGDVFIEIPETLTYPNLVLTGNTNLFIEGNLVGVNTISLQGNSILTFFLNGSGRII